MTSQQNINIATLPSTFPLVDFKLEVFELRQEIAIPYD